MTNAFHHDNPGGRFGEGPCLQEDDLSWEDLPHSLAVPALHRPQARLQGRISDGSARRRYNPSLLASIDLRDVSPAYSELPTLKPGSRAEKKRKKAPLKRASLLNPTAIRRVEEHLRDNSRSFESDLLKFRLSIRGGLRAGEIADLPIDAMLNASGRIEDTIDVYASKTDKRRSVPMHPEVHEALANLLARYPYASYAAFSVGRHGTLRRQSASCLSNWFFRLYDKVDLIGCSSHSGRRTFATEVARNLAANQCSLKELQNVLGHASLSSTECYLEPSDRIGQLIQRLGS